ncbi:MAG: redoxin domain-containing protein [Akkermansiaceae bacterium]|nr:redoxin domain-containing protein [Akkermansiaceae bacterium]
MAKVRIDFNLQLLTQDGRRPTSLAALAGDSRHVLLHFWSPWSEECEAYLPDFLTTASHLEKNGLRVVSVLAELGPEVLPDADAFRAAAADRSPAAWILENEKSPLGRLLRVQNLPTAVLVDRTGSVLFNGHPADERMWNALHDAVPQIVRPDLPPAERQEPPNPAE